MYYDGDVIEDKSLHMGSPQSAEKMFYHPQKTRVFTCQAIYSSLEEQFPGDPEAWDLRARRWLGPHPREVLPDESSPPGSISPAEQAALGTYEEALASTSGADMCDRYAAFLMERLEAGPDPGGGQPATRDGRKKQLTKRLLKVWHGVLRAAHEGVKAILMT